jgi:molybdopterin-binding protein
MKISARNNLEGVIKDVHKGATTAHVEIELKGRPDRDRFHHK